MESTPSKALASAHRLLYRGSLSLSDSHLLLDGLSFTVKAAATHGSPALLNNTLALSLESLRGLPLHLIGTVRVKDVWIEPPPADISIDIHPEATLTRIYFENLFCLNPITSEDRKSEYGIRVSLTDNDDPDAPDLIIYAELRPSPPSSSSSTSAPPSSPSPATASTSHAPPHTLHLLAARILPAPPPPPRPPFRLPRPDDPTPRRPPLTFGAGAGAGSKRKRESVLFDLSGAQGEAATKRARDASANAKGKDRAVGTLGLGMDAKALGKDARVGAGKDRGGDVFKVPSVPVRRTMSEADVFGCSATSGKGKEKEKGGERHEKEGKEAGVERDNKNAVKRAAIKALAREGIGKTHADFKELYNPTYYGVCAALRRRMATGPLDGSMIEHFVDAHVKMYVNDAPE